MAARIFPVVKLATKVGIAGGAVYVAYDSGLLGGSAEGSEALSKAKAAIPPAVDEWSKYFGLELPAAPKIEFSPCDAWNSGVRKSIHALSVAPSVMCEYTSQGLQYVKDLIK
ncbi:MICOS complex subunit MIC13 [Ictalurus punctatus]|uniref:MICOS complex subunit MIC13 n=2 Tax=Ictalurus TaxID=7997 RepID=E3TCU3_ICTFU|nr:MICOS complex subunit MIC13 [Ictalurus punctatus]ADO28129.1 qil1 [Ictalurus furcatus]